MSAKNHLSLRHLLLSGLIVILFILAVSDDALLALLRYGRVSAAETLAPVGSAAVSSGTAAPQYDTPAATAAVTAAPSNSGGNISTAPTVTSVPASEPVSDSNPAASAPSETPASTAAENPALSTQASLSAPSPDKSASDPDDSAHTASAPPAAAPENQENEDTSTGETQHSALAISPATGEEKMAAASPSVSATAAQETSEEDIHRRLGLGIQPGEKFTEDRKLCTQPLPVKPDKPIAFRLEGPTNRSILAYEPAFLTYCFNLVLADFSSGSYKLTVEAQIGGKVLTSTSSIEIDRSGSPEALAQKAAELENRCSQEGAADSEECKQYYLDKYGEKISCRDMESEECHAVAKDSYIGAIVKAEKTYERIGEQTDDLLGESMTAGKLENLINQANGKKVLDFSTPLVKKETEIRVIPSYESVILGKYDGLKLTAPIVILIDTDGDGASDDIEQRLGTDPEAKDTDGDGYTDSEELVHGYDPLGEGKRDAGLSPVEKILLEGKAIGQPTDSGEVSTDLTVAEVKIVYSEDGDEESYMITGKAAPNTVFTLYVYSDVPVVATVKTDASGNWEYHFENALQYGGHEIYIATNDETGKVITKSSPLSFLIEEAQAAAAGDDGAAKSGHDSDSMVSYYIYAAGALIVIGIGIFLLVLAKSRNKTQK